MVGDSTVKIVALNGSPHRSGNTVTLMRWVLEGCLELGASVDWIHLVDHHVKYCQGCFTCLRRGVCPIQDDFLVIREKLIAADGLVVGSPVYEGGPTSQLKTLMDRLTLLHLYTNLFEHTFSVGVATSGIAPTNQLSKDLATYFGRRSGIIGAKTSTVAQGYQPLIDVHHPRLSERARRVGRRLVVDIRSAQRFRLPQWRMLFHQWLWRSYIRPMAVNNPHQFSAVLGILEKKGKLPRECLPRPIPGDFSIERTGDEQ